MVVTDEICGILLRGDAKVPENVESVIDATLGQTAEPSEYVDVMDTYNKKGNILIKTESILLNCSFEDGVANVRQVAMKIRKKILELEVAPTKFPYMAYLNKGLTVNPTIGVVEVVPSGVTCKLELTVITNRSGIKKGHSATASIDRFIDVWEDMFGEIEG